MAFTPIELTHIHAAADRFMAKRRPPAHIRDQVDFELAIRGQSVELVEVRPFWKDPTQITRHGFAKATYVRTDDRWKVYWMRATLKWHAYDPPVVATVAEFFRLVDEDRLCCFFG